jgi:hypothetical protein
MEVVTVLSACLTPTIGILTVYIACCQHRTARNKVRLDLYERRFRVYHGLFELLDSVMCSATVPLEALNKYDLATAEKRFLFNRDVMGYMSDFRFRAVQLGQLSREIETSHEGSTPQRDAAVFEHKELLVWFAEQVEVAPAKFESYLGFGKNL